MGGNSGGNRSTSALAKKRVSDYKNDPDSLQVTKQSIMYYSKIDRWNQNTSYNQGFNDDVQSVIEEIAEGNYGLATDIAKGLVSRNGWKQYGTTVSEKQAYVLSKTIVDKGLVLKNGEPRSAIWDPKVLKDVRKERAIKAQERARKRQSYESSYKRSTTKVAIGSKVFSKHGEGEITGIITKSTGYVTVKYSNGITRKEMAFNLNGADGNPLKKRPK
jgi:hypothetical protein